MANSQHSQTTSRPSSEVLTLRGERGAVFLRGRSNTIEVKPAIAA